MKENLKEVELPDGGCLEPPTADDSAIRRRDVHGNLEEIREIGDEGWQEWAALFGVGQADFYPVATLKDCIVWAKDRLIDDVKFGLMDDLYQDNYAAMGDEGRANFRQEYEKTNRLMQLPEDSYDSLRELKEAGYWNGAADSYWESFTPPETRPPGIGDDLMPVSA